VSYSPYAPPLHDQNPYAAGGYGYGYAPQFQYQPLGWKTTASIVGMIGMVVFQFLQTALTLAAGDALKHPQDPGNAPMILLVAAVGLLAGVIGIGTYVVFLMWMYHAAKNVRAFGQQGLEHSPGWCVGWWFIPIANLFKPYTAMREIWRASDPETVGPQAKVRWSAAPVGPLLALWWSAHLIHGFVATGIALQGFFEHFHQAMQGKQTAQAASPTFFIGHVLLGIACVFIVMIFRQMAQRQALAWERLAGGSQIVAYGAQPEGAYGASAPQHSANPYAPSAWTAPNPYAPPAEPKPATTAAAGDNPYAPPPDDNPYAATVAAPAPGPAPAPAPAASVGGPATDYGKWGPPGGGGGPPPAPSV